MNNQVKNRIVCSMTTWSKRINQCKPTVIDILTQTRKPDLFVINLDFDNFPNGYVDIPEWLKELDKEYDNLEIHFEEHDMKVYEKFIPTIRRYTGDDYILVTHDCDVNYPSTYLEEIEENMKDCDWLCTKDDVITRGQEMVYGPRAVAALREEIDDDLILNIPLDDHLCFWVLNKYKLKRGHKIKSQTSDRQAGYSFRRFFVETDDISKLQDTSCDYPFEEFVKERAYMQKRGIV